MNNKIKIEVRRVGRMQFPRWIILDDGTNLPTQRRFWDGTAWVTGLRNAALYAHKRLVLKDLERVKGE